MSIKSLELLNNFAEKLQDEESKKLFVARFDYLVYKDKEKFYEKLDDILLDRKRSYTCWHLDRYYERHPQNREKK